MLLSFSILVIIKNFYIFKLRLHPWEMIHSDTLFEMFSFRVNSTINRRVIKIEQLLPNFGYYLLIPSFLSLIFSHFYILKNVSVPFSFYPVSESEKCLRIFSPFFPSSFDWSPPQLGEKFFLLLTAELKASEWTKRPTGADWLVARLELWFIFFRIDYFFFFFRWCEKV